MMIRSKRFSDLVIVKRTGQQIVQGREEKHQPSEKVLE